MIIFSMFVLVQRFSFNLLKIFIFDLINRYDFTCIPLYWVKVLDNLLKKVFIKSKYFD